MTDRIAFRWLVILVIIGLAGWSLYSNPFNWGIDLRGGVTLTYSIDRQSIEEAREQDTSLEGALDDTVRIISIRINTLGVKDLSVRREGTRRILIQAPNMSDRDLDDIKSRMVQLGKLEFPIGVGTVDAGKNTASVKIPGTSIGQSITINFDQTVADQQRQARIDADWPKVREAVQAGQEIPDTLYRPGMPYQYVHEGTPTPIFWKPWAPGQAVKQNLVGGASEDEAIAALNNARLGRPYEAGQIAGAWLYFDPDWYGEDRPGFTGADIKNVNRSTDRNGLRAVSYEVNKERQGDFSLYTGDYVGRPKCLVLNDEIWSAPTINQALSDNVQISGGSDGFTKEEQTWLVECLQSGSLKLRPIHESEEKIDPTLGETAKTRGIWATGIAGGLIVVFMLMYYGFSGLVAVIALALNLVLMLALLALFQATITLPGIAGIILTIGMSVDANILIFERIREEMAKGKTLIASVQTGFDRAFVTIIDANLTTVITAIILYKYGVGPIKGFAVTLMAGIACSLFTALFFSKTMFATALSREWIKSLSMRSIVPPDIRKNFVGGAKKAMTISVIGVALALAAWFLTDPYGLDFTGGTKVRVNVLGDISSQEIKTRLLGLEEDGEKKYPQVDVTRLSAQTTINGKSFNSFDLHLQNTRRMKVEEFQAIIEPHLKSMFGETLFTSLSTPTALDDGNWTVEFTLSGKMSESEADTQVTSWREPVRLTTPYETARVTALEFDEQDGEKIGNVFLLKINEKNLSGKKEVLDEMAGLFTNQLPTMTDGSIDYALAFPKLSFMGPNVVANLRVQAMVSIILSLIALILYIWFRFKEIKYGVAAAVAVFHDVIIALGVVVTMNAIGLVHVPINLPIIAGFLTIIGYSLNDTIVLFDRVRENLGNVKGNFSDVVNLSINQTLSRTLLTSITTFVVVLILFVLNYGAESPIEGIAFTLMIGVLVGTYSSIFIASPLVIWMHNREVDAKKTVSSKS